MKVRGATRTAHKTLTFLVQALILKKDTTIFLIVLSFLEDIKNAISCESSFDDSHEISNLVSSFCLQQIKCGTLRDKTFF